MSRLIVIVLVALSSLLLPIASASGQEASEPALRLLLRAHHQAPSTEALTCAAGDPVEALIAVVRDAGELLLVRRRAAALLARFPGERSEEFLVELLGSPEGDLRRASARALATMLIDGDPERLVELLERLLESADPLDREAAVWLLARVDQPAARERLARQRVVERHRAVVDALRRVARGAIGDEGLERETGSRGDFQR